MHHEHHKCIIETGKINIVLVGNPNVGKSAIFNQVSVKKATVSNYPGTTVEIFSSRIKTFENSVIIDTPGVYNLFKVGSEDEKVTREFLLKYDVDRIVLVIDSKNLERGIYLLLQLLELEVPIVVSLNMFDEASRRGIDIDEKKLEEIFGIKFIKTIATEGYGLKSLIDTIMKIKDTSKRFMIKYPEEFETKIKEVEELLVGFKHRRFLAICCLLDFENIKNILEEKLDSNKIKKIEELSKGKDYDIIVYNTLRKNVNRILKQVVKKRKIEHKSLSEKIDSYLLHPVYIIPTIFLTLLFLYYFVGVFGAGILVDFLEEDIFGEKINPYVTELFKKYIGNNIITDLFVGEYGIITFALTYAFSIILPVVTTFFIAFSILEDSGYLPRLVSYLHILFKKIGLSGKAIIPTALGFGCVTMATITTRTLSTKKERKILTFLLALTIPCSAQQAVILALIIGLGFKVLVGWMLTIILVYSFFGYVLSKLIRTEERSYFIYDLPPLRLPLISNVLLKTYLRLKWYITEVVPLYILASIILVLFDKVGVLNVLYEILSPIVVGWLNLPKEAALAFILGFLRRDYGAAGFFALNEKGLLTEEQLIVSVVTITLFVPCIANFLMIIKERGKLFGIVAFLSIITIAFIIGGIVNLILKVI